MNQLPTTRRSNRSWMAFVGTLAALTIGCALLPAVASAAPANDAAGSYSPSVWAETSDTGPAPTVPSLTNRVGQPDTTNSQLPIGLRLLGLGVLGLLTGLALTRATPRGATAGLTATRGWDGTARLTSGADMVP